MTINKKQARKFLLSRHGLLGEYVFDGKEGVMSFVRRVGCVQYDPVDICGRNADIVLHSRIKGYSAKTLEELLYADRRLIDFFDKNLSVFPVEDYPFFLNARLSGGYAEAYDRRGGDAVRQTEPLIRAFLDKNEYVSAKDLGVDSTIEWHWGTMSSLPRAALESMYFRGELIIHHKTGTNKSYAFTKDYIPDGIMNSAPPFATETERLAWLVKRRIGAVGMLWNKASDAWLGLRLKAAERSAAFRQLLDAGEIFEISVEGIKDRLFVLEDERAALMTALSGGDAPARMEFLAPLDSLLWDRNLIEAVFGFAYKWEIYTPKEKRKYGPYTLPVLYGDAFIGRIDMARRDGRLVINDIWYEDGRTPSKEVLAALEEYLDRYSIFANCTGRERTSRA